MSWRILHLARDDKFLPLAMRLYEEAFPGSNEWRLEVRDGSRFRFTEESPSVRHVSGEYFQSVEARQAVAQADCVVLHAVTPYTPDAVEDAPPGPLVVWCGWGYEYYNGLLSLQLGGLELPQTEQLVAELPRAAAPPTAARLAEKLRRGLKKGMIRRSDPRHPMERVAARIDVFSVLPQEVELLRTALPQLNAKFHMLPYFTVEDTFSAGPPEMKGPNILLGNSATPSNNHLEALDELRSVDLGDAKIIAPLSYGSDEYAAAVSRRGSELFGSAFIPLHQFLDLGDYYDTISGCGVVIMNHRRQQALGNISLALYKGAKVFLRPENPVYSFYFDMGAQLCTIAQLHDPGVFSPLSAEARAQNRAVVCRRWARGYVLEQIRALPRFARRAA